MKIFKNLILILFLAVFFVSFIAEKPKYQKEDFKVWGKCEMCKTTIEKTVRSIEGVKKARWNIVKNSMKVKFNPEKTTLEKIHKAIAAVGYDTELFKASDESYNNLHYCCKYERK